MRLQDKPGGGCGVQPRKTGECGSGHGNGRLDGADKVVAVTQLLARLLRGKDVAPGHKALRLRRR